MTDCMDFRTITERSNTDALRGVAALAILSFHVLLPFAASPLTNFWGGMLVAVFLLLSGYGINEAYKRRGLARFWQHRWQRVVLPTLAFATAWNFLMPEGGMENWLLELTYRRPTYWFVFHVMKCYAVYWLVMRFAPRHAVPLLSLAAVGCLLYPACGTHLESEQAFSFLAGVLFSRYGDRLAHVPAAKWWRWAALCFVGGGALFALKAIPAVHEWKGTVAYHFLQCPFRLLWGMAAVVVLSAAGTLRRAKWLQWAGRHSLEIYVGHIPFLPLINGPEGLAAFLLCSLLSIAALILFTARVVPQLSLPVAAYVGINAVFVAKYGRRVTPDYYVAVTAAATVFFYLFATFFLPKLPRGRRARTWAVALSLLLVLMAVAQQLIDPYQIQVDRWSALHNPISFLLDGKYPYTASTHLGGYASPFPVWQVAHIPFYLLGNVGLSFFAALAFFLYALGRTQGSRSALVALTALMAAPAVWYEAMVRSDLMTNILLTAGLCLLTLPRLSETWLARHAAAVAVGVALLASTRLVTLPVAALLLLPYYLRLNRGRQVLMAAICALTFAATFLPFALWDWQQFYHFEYNPWTLQTRQGQTADFLLFVPLALWLALQWRGSSYRFHRNAALFLLCFIGLTFLHLMVSGDNYDLFSSRYDITYLSTALPFTIAALSSPHKSP